MTDSSRIRELAVEAAKKIKALNDAHHAQILQIYQDFCVQVADVIRSKASTKDLAGPGADLLPKTEVNEP